MPRLLAIAAAAASLGLAGCAVEVRGGPVLLGAPPPPPPGAPAAPPPPPAPPPVAAPGPAARPDPAARAMFQRGGAPPLALAPLPMAPPGVAARGLAATVAAESAPPGPVGPPLIAILREGDRARAPVEIPAGECAGFAAQGGLGVVEVDLFVTPPGDAATILAEDVGAGPVAVVGGRAAVGPSSPVCAAAAPIPVEIHAQVRRGAGAVLVQRFRAARRN